VIEINVEIKQKRGYGCIKTISNKSPEEGGQNVNGG
jgi:hypothetical protein